MNAFSLAHRLRRRPLLRLLCAGLAAGLLWLDSLATTHAATLIASDGAAGDNLGFSVSGSSTISLAGAYFATIGSNNSQGAAYVFRNLDTASGTVTQNVKLTASDGATADLFGWSVGQSGGIGLVGAHQADIGSNSNQGAAYVFRNLDTASGTVTQDVKLTASDGAAIDHFGYSVSQSGSIGLVGAYNAKVGSNSAQGAAYVFRNLDTAGGTVTQDVKLTASDGASGNQLGDSVSLSGSIGLVGAWRAKIGSNNFQGAAYVFRNLDTATGTVTQNVKLTASDGAANDRFGYSVSQSDSIGLVGAYQANSNQGAAYVFRNLDTATGTVTQNVKLTASDGAAGDFFSYSVSQSGTVGLVGAYQAKIGLYSAAGAAYVFRNLDTASGTVTQNVKLTASDGAPGDLFGSSVSLSGDQFTVGAYGANSSTGKAYTGTISSVTTLDAGSTNRTIDGISFVSQDDWIIGQNSSGNAVTLLSGNSADVTASGKAVYVGQNAGSNNNTLTVNGTLTANQVNLGAAGNTGNHLVVNGTTSVPVNVASGSTLSGHGLVGLITGAGTVAPGDPQILTAVSVDPSTGMSFGFVMQQTGEPTYSNPSASGNDVLRLTGPTPFTQALSAANLVTVDFTGANPLIGQNYLGGFYTDSGDNSANILGADFSFLGLGSGESVAVSMVPDSQYTGGGYITQFTIVGSAPEPSRALLLMAGLAMMGMRRRR